MRRLTILALAAAVVATPLVAQRVPQMLSGKGTPAEIKAGTFVIDSNHTQVAFSVTHMGISPYSGGFGDATGTLTLDPAKLDQSTLTITLPTGGVMTTSEKLTGELKSVDWLDAKKYPTATFRSTRITRMGADKARVEGTLTLHGVTRPVALDAHFFGTAVNPMNKKDSIGFTGRMSINRSDFGVDKYVPLVSDETVLTINAAFERQ